MPRVRGRALRERRHRAATSRSRYPARRGRATPFGRRLARDFRRATGLALPDPAARPSRVPARGAALAGVDAVLGRPLLRDEGGAGAPHPPARPRRRREPQRLRLHRRLHPLGLHAARAASPTSSRPTPTSATRSATAPAGAATTPASAPSCWPTSRASACGSSSRRSTTRATSRCRGDLWTWTAQALRAGRHRHQLLRLGQPAVHRPPPLRRDARHRPRLRGARLPAPPADPEQLVAVRDRERGPGAARPRPGASATAPAGDALYTTYSLLGELARRRVQLRRRHPPGRRAGAPGGGADHLAAARRHARRRRSPTGSPPGCAAGGTLVVTDPDAFTRTPSGAR